MTRWPWSGRSRREADLEAELQSHVNLAVRDLVARGESPQAARQAALREFGNVTLTREATQRTWTGERLRDSVVDLVHDLRYALRLLRRSPGFAAVTIVVMALGIGANASVFALFKSAFLKPLPGVSNPQDLVVLQQETRAGQVMSLSYREYEYVRDNNSTFESLGAAAAVPFSLKLDSGAERVWGEFVSGNYFQMLRVTPAVGRIVTPADDVPGGQPVAVISEGLWRRSFAADSGVVGRTLTINGQPLTIIGVAAGSFRGSMVGVVLDLFVPLTMQPRLSPEDMLHGARTRWLMGLGRLKAGVSIEAAAAQTRLLAYQAVEAQAEPESRAVILPLWRSPFGAQTYILPVVGILGPMAALLLLIVCANVANLVLVRGVMRRGEIAVRLALGATRRRIVRLLLMENLILAGAGACAGLAISQYLLGISAGAGDASIAPFPLMLDVSADWTVVGFASLVSCASALLCGFMPALRCSRVPLASIIKDDASIMASGRGRVRSVLVMSQVAVSLLLLVGAALVSRSLAAAREAEVGFEPRNVVSVTLHVQSNGYDEARGRAFYDRLLERTRSAPGVVSAALAMVPPLGLIESSTRGVRIEGYEPRRNENMSVAYNTIGSGYFRTLGIDLVAGRDFDIHDTPNAQLVALVNETMSRRFWKTPDQAIGKRLRTGGVWLTVVGVARDIKYLTVTEDPRVFLYLPFSQHYAQGMIAHARTSLPSDEALRSVRRIVEAIDPSLPIHDARTMSDQVRFAFAGYEMAAGMLSIFGLLAITLASIGLYGLVAYAAQQGRHEIGVRMALGARRSDVIRRFVGRGMRLALIGIGAGVALAAATTRLLQGALYGVSAVDGLSFASAAAIAGAVSVVASLIPAWWAARTDPSVALRHR